MPLNFSPNYTITSKIANALLKIERIKERIKGLPITPSVLASLRESAKLYSTHYSTLIEGNRLSEKDVQDVIKENKSFDGRERDEGEVKGYYSAIAEVEKIAEQQKSLTEKKIQLIHALVSSNGITKVKPSPFRDGQNVIKDSLTGRIVYMPPEAKDVPDLMNAMVNWLNETKEELPCSIRAGIAHYQFATIHPYYDGNGRTARLLATLILHLGGYDLKGLYSLEEYYAKNLSAYYDAITVGTSHNYYMGRAEADITGWVQYFVEGMAEAFEKIEKHSLKAADNFEGDQSPLLRKLDPKQRKVLALFKQQEVITSNDLALFFNFSSRSARQLALTWHKEGFLEAINTSKKGRKYKLSNNLGLIKE
ncbi:MAG: Fic family protein [Candidatus Gastranaerophilales bacterium]|nr:Fic family protein [Candidatus Gastranaerophilales bacterium]